MNVAQVTQGQSDLFPEGSGGSTPTPALQFPIAKIDHLTAADWVKKWHYTKRMPTGKNLCYGVFDECGLYAVIVYGIGVNPYQAKFLGVSNVLEIKRLCRREPPNPKYQLSRFIAISSRCAASECPCDCIVAFADPEQGHEGTVYRASGFQFHGITGAEWHLSDSNGNKRHRRFAFRHARRNNMSISESRTELGLVRVKTQPKYRWVKNMAQLESQKGEAK